MVLKRCAELRYRAEGTSVIAADIRAFKMKDHNAETTLYRLAKMIHQPRAQVNGFYRQLQKLGILPESSRV